MKFNILLTSLILALVSKAEIVQYDETYDKPDQSLSSVACSDGDNGLIMHGYTTFGTVPGFPNVGGASAIEGWNSDQCGQCWELNYTSETLNNTITMAGIDVAKDGFVLSKAAMDKLTGNQAADLGHVNVEARKVECTF